jgi:inner membrane protease subunit 2
LFDRASVRLSYDFRKDDIVAFRCELDDHMLNALLIEHKRSPQNRNHMLVKRIVGVEGDVVKTLPPYPESIVRVPPGHVWVEGVGFC